jgi:hypothetical protein
MNERDARSVRPGARHVVDHPDAPAFEVGDCGINVRHAEAEVMQAGAPLRQKLRDRRLGRHRLDELDRRAAGLDEAHAMVDDALGIVGPKTEQALEERDKLAGVLNGDTDVVELQIDSGSRV